MYHLNKPIYGLKQASRVWNQKLTSSEIGAETKTRNKDLQEAKMDTLYFIYTCKME